MKQPPNSKYDLEERTYQFAKECRDYVRTLPKSIGNIEYGKQLIRSSGSVAANYIEANESISKKDFSHRVKIARKEVKESSLWLRLSDTRESSVLREARIRLIAETVELGKIFGAILEKVK